jgi:hypothetical protein
MQLTAGNVQRKAVLQAADEMLQMEFLFPCKNAAINLERLLTAHLTQILRVLVSNFYGTLCITGV